MKIKKMFSLLLSMVICISFPLQALGALGDSSTITPYYVNIDVIVPLISEEDGDLYASISVGTHVTCSVEITMSIERSAHGTSWSTYRSYPKVTLNSGGSRTASQIAYDVPGGYYYRTYGTIKVYVNGTLTDSETIESDPIYVSILNN
ncbi:MAG: hypothetical protein IJA17_03030 [Oscillospiraceae bacterium]|nr:hypothetical protein [Oscillospiraceae bacterium]